MFWTSDGGRRFKLPSKPVPRKELEWDRADVNEQTQCGFLTRLPAEIRNEVYRLVFETNSGLYEEDPERPVENERSLEGGGKNWNWDFNRDDEEVGGARDREDIEGENVDKDKITTKTSNAIIRKRVDESRPAHPLSLLLTCRLINLEATLLAFSTYTFATSHQLYTTFFTLQIVVSHLSYYQFNAITNLAFDIYRDYAAETGKVSDFLSNTLLLFPGVKRLEVRCKRGIDHPNTVHTGMFDAVTYDIGGKNAMQEEWMGRAAKRYVPRWFQTTLHHVVCGRAYSWQKGQKWCIYYPALEYPQLTFQTDFSSPNAPETTAVISPDYAGLLPGIELCTCGCGSASWVLAQLVQETGRKVEVEVLFYEDSEAERERERKGLTVRLRPNVEHLPVVNVNGGRGLVWDAHEEYWSGLRMRKGWILGGWKGYLGGMFKDRLS